MVKFIHCETRPWGSFTTIIGCRFFWVKLLRLQPWHAISLQHHTGRWEFWVRLHGRSKVTKASAHVSLSARAWRFLVVPRLYRHRLMNIDHEDILVLEISWGRCMENDITRHKDSYGRVQVVGRK